MTKFIKKVLLMTILLATTGVNAFEDTPPVPQLETTPFRLSLIGVGNVRGYQEGPFGINQLGLSLGFSQLIGSGFYWGAALKGSAYGAADRYQTATNLFENNRTYGGLGANVGVRYLGALTRMLYLGAQITAGYTHAVVGPDMNGAGAVNFNAGIPLTLAIADFVYLYLLPEFQMCVPNAGANWGNSENLTMGYSAKLGTMIELGTVGLVLAVGVGSTTFDSVTESMYGLFSAGVTFDI